MLFDLRVHSAALRWKRPRRLRQLNATVIGWYCCRNRWTTRPIAVKEWLEAKLHEPVVEDEPRFTNHYLCPNDNVRWDARWSCLCNDRCSTSDAVVEPYAMTNNSDDSEVIHDREVYNRANVVEQ